MKINWYNKTLEETAAILGSSLDGGLTAADAEMRIGKDGENLIFDSEIPGASRGIWGFLFDFSSLLLLLTAVICLFLSHLTLFAVIFAVWAVNRLISGVAYLSGINTFMLHRIRALPRVRVLRRRNKNDDTPGIFTTDIRRIAKGDLILLHRGDFIPCDARIVACDELVVNEYRLSGIGTPIFKNNKVISGAQKPSEITNMVFAGTAVLSGEALVMVTATGNDTEIVSKKGLLAIGARSDTNCSYQYLKNQAVSDTFFPTSLLCRVQGILTLVLAFAACIAALGYGLVDDGLFLIFVSSACAAAASMNELLFAGWSFLLNIILKQLSKQSSGRDEAIVLSPEKITLDGNISSVIASLSMLVGRDELEVTTLVTPSGNICELKFDSAQKDEAVLRRALAVLAQAYVTPEFAAVKNIPQIENFLPKNSHVEKEDAFNENSDMKVATLTCGEKQITYRANTPEALLSTCTHFSDGGKIIPLSDTTRQGLSAIVAHYRKSGCKVYAVAASDKQFLQSKRTDKSGKTELLGFFVCRERRNVGADAFLRETLGSGMRLRIITELPTEQARQICGTLGLDIKTLRVFSPSSPSEKITEAVLQYGLYCGLTRHQKKELITLIKEKEGRCAVISDLPEDAKLLLEADMALTPVSFKLSQNQKYRPKGCSALALSADVLTGESPGAAARVLSRAKNIRAAMANSACFLCTTQLCRMLWFAISLFAFKIAPAPTGILILGLILDLLGVLLIAYRASRKKSIRIIRSSHEIFKYISYAVVWCIITVTACAFMKLLSLECDFTVLGFSSILLFTPFIALLATHGEGRRNGIKLSSLHLLYFALSVVLILLVYFIPAVSVLLCGAVICTGELLAAVICCVLSFAFSLAIASVGSKGTEKDD